MVDASELRGERRSWWVGVAVIAVFVLIGSLSLGYSLYEPSAAAESSSPAPDEPTPTVQLLKATFVDQTHGYLIVETCEDSRDTDTCGTELRVTADGGQTWAKRTLPEVSGSNPIGVDDNAMVYSLGIDRLVIDVPGKLDPSTGLLNVAGHRFFSEDGGKTWEQRPRKPNGTVTEVPTNGTLIYPVPDPDDRKEGENIAPQVLRADGTAAVLAKGPRYDVVPALPAIVATDGSIWAVAATPASVSHDHGRTWQPIKLPKLDKGAQTFVRTSDGKDTYLIAGLNGELAGLYSSTDGARSWHKLSLPESSAGSAGAQGFAESPDGSFLLLFDSKLYRYGIGDTSPEEVQLTGGLAFSLLAVGDHAVVSKAGESDDATFYVTVNGTDWIPVSLRIGG
jgi:photosystem II stability/assembly factor-like uncharacterized protein